MQIDSRDAGLQSIGGELKAFGPAGSRRLELLKVGRYCARVEARRASECGAINYGVMSIALQEHRQRSCRILVAVLSTWLLQQRNHTRGNIVIRGEN